jgi:hypothetical protein
MEGTGDFFAIKGPFRKRPTAMATSIIDSMERTLHIKEGDLLATNLDHLPLPRNNLIGLRYLHKICHDSPPIKFLLERLNLHSIRLTSSLPGIRDRSTGTAKT